MATKLLLASALASMFALSAAYAQTDTPTPAAPPATAETPAPAAPVETPAPAETAAPGAPANPASMTPREVRQQCRQQFFAQGMRGPTLRSAVDDCFAKARPDVVIILKCRKEADAQNLTGQQLHQYMRSCRAKGM